MKNYKIAVVLATVSIAACASHPDKMTSSYVSPMQFQDYSCKQIAGEAGNIERKIGDLYGTLDKTASNDDWQMGVGIVLFWPTLFFLEGGDGAQAVEYRQLKGEYEALEKVAVQKECSYRFQEYKAPKEEVKKNKSAMNDG